MWKKQLPRKLSFLWLEVMTSCNMLLLSCYCPLVCLSRLDLAFLIDGSGSIAKSGKGNFRRCLNFVKRIVASFKISPSYTRVGAAVFSTGTWLVFDFKRYRTKQQIFRAIDGIRYPRGGTRIGRALEFVQYKMFRGSRAQKVSIYKDLFLKEFLNMNLLMIISKGSVVCVGMV